MDTRFEGNGEDVVVVLAIVIDQKRFSDLKLLLIINVFIFNQVIKTIMHIVNEIPIDIFFDSIYLAIQSDPTDLTGYVSLFLSRTDIRMPV